MTLITLQMKQDDDKNNSQMLQVKVPGKPAPRSSVLKVLFLVAAIVLVVLPRTIGTLISPAATAATVALTPILLLVPVLTVALVTLGILISIPLKWN